MNVSLIVGWATSAADLRRTLRSLQRQDVKGWELVVPRVALKEPSEGTEAFPEDKRIRYVELPGPLDDDAGASLEAARRAATGTLIGVLAAGDEIEPGGLAAALMLVEGDSEGGGAAADLDLVYTDEQWPGQGADGIATKPDWLPHYLQSYPYTGRLCLVRAEVAERAGGFRPGFPGAEEWDLALRVTELTDRIGHVPVVAVSRAAAPRQDDVAIASGLRAVQGRIDRSGRAGYAEQADVPRGVRLWWTVDEPPLVSVVVPTAGGRREIRGEPDVLLVERAVRSLLERTTYQRWELVLVGGPPPQDLIPELLPALGDRVRHAPIDGPFNFSTSVNEGARVSRGELLLLLNDDTEAIEPRWLERMVSVALDPAVGAVGARLMFENGTIQHVGVIFDNGMSPIHALGSEVDDAGRFGSKVLDLDYPAVTGACLLTPASLFREVGGFCVDLPLNFNDIDYCLKVAASGHAVVTAGFATLFHYESSTRGHATEPEEFTFLDRHWGLRRRLDQHVHYRSVL